MHSILFLQQAYNVERHPFSSPLGENLGSLSWMQEQWINNASDGFAFSEVDVARNLVPSAGIDNSFKY